MSNEFLKRNQPPPLPFRLKKDGTPDKRFKLYKVMQIESAIIKSVASIIPKRLRGHSAKDIIIEYYDEMQ